jgi:hypothetical protein
MWTQWKQVLKGFQEGQELTILWTHHSEGTRHDFTIDSIYRGTEKRRCWCSGTERDPQ